MSLSTDNRDMQEVEKYLRAEKDALRERLSHIAAECRKRNCSSFEELIGDFDRLKNAVGFYQS